MLEDLTNTPVGHVDELSSTERSQNSASGSRKSRANRPQAQRRRVLADSRHENEFLLLEDALQEANDASDDDEMVDIVLVPPPNSSNGDTDTEQGDEETVTSNELRHVKEVSGTLEVHSSRSTSRVSKEKIYQTLPPNYMDIVAQEVSNVERIANSNVIDYGTQIDNLIESACLFDNLRKWKVVSDDEGTGGLEWQTALSPENSNDLENLHSTCGGKLPVEIFEMLFNCDLQNHIVSESVLYASQQNKSDFSLSVNDLKTFVAGNHSLPQQKLYWERNRDVSVPMVFQSISKNRFVEIFNCCSQE